MSLRLYIYSTFYYILSPSLIFPETCLWMPSPALGVNSGVSNLHFLLVVLFLVKDLICGPPIICFYTVPVTASPKGIVFPLIMLSLFSHSCIYLPVSISHIVHPWRPSQVCILLNTKQCFACNSSRVNVVRLNVQLLIFLKIREKLHNATLVNENGKSKCNPPQNWADGCL